MNDNKTVILLAAYTLHPEFNGRKNAAWKFLMQIARFNKVIVITRGIFKQDISRFLNENSVPANEQIEFNYFDIPFVSDKINSNGLHHLIWQYQLPGFILKNKFSFDVVHHMGLSDEWNPSFLGKLKKPTVVGPVGFQPRVPKNYLVHVYGWRSYLRQESKWWLNKMMRNSNLIFQPEIEFADAVWAVDEPHQINTHHSNKQVIQMPLAGDDARISIRQIRKGEGFTVLSRGEFIPENGFDLTIRSFARFYHPLPVHLKSRVRMVLIGQGAATDYLKTLVTEMELDGIVQFVIPSASADLEKLYAESDVYLYGGHQGSCEYLSEALAMSLPVICFKDGVFGSYVSKENGITIPAGRYDSTLTRFAEGLRLLYENPALYARLSEGARKMFMEKFSWEKKGERLNELYNNLLRMAS